MKKIILLIIILLYVGINLVPQDLKFTKDLLILSKWVPKDGGIGYWLEFDKYNNYTISFEGEGGGQEIHGEYLIENNVLILNVKDITENRIPPNDLKIKRTEWKIYEDNENLFYTIKITSNNNYTFWRQESKINPNEIRHVDNNKIIIVKMQTTEILYNTKVRKGPGKNYDSYNFKTIEDKMIYPYLPKDWNADIIVIGRTENIEKIDNMEDYWYYCEINIGLYYEGPSNGWIYGGLLNIK